MARIKSRHQRPYSLHLPAHRTLERLDAPPESDRRRTRVLNVRDIVEFRDALNLVTRYCEYATHVAAFAMGGLACIEYIARAAGAGTAASLQPFLEKFHVFGGLNWIHGGSENKNHFDRWIRAVAPGSSVILFDTGRVGNAAGQLLNRMHYLRNSPEGLPDRLTVQIIVLGERARPNGKDHWQKDFHGPALTLIRDVYRVADVITEDALRLAGYTKLGELGALQPVWVQGHLDLRRGDGSITRMSSASIGPAFVNEMLSNFAHLNQTIDAFPPEQLVTGDKGRSWVSRVAAVIMALLAVVFVVRILRRPPLDDA
jgi:hypothetical protein